jgi:hypothetical protein
LFGVLTMLKEGRRFSAFGVTQLLRNSHNLGLWGNCTPQLIKIYLPLIAGDHRVPRSGWWMERNTDGDASIESDVCNILGPESLSYDSI